MLAVAHDQRPADRDVDDPGRVPVRVVVGGVILDALGIEHDDVGE